MMSSLVKELDHLNHIIEDEGCNIDYFDFCRYYFDFCTPILTLFISAKLHLRCIYKV
jgi:hypothetical protein